MRQSEILRVIMRSWREATDTRPARYAVRTLPVEPSRVARGLVPRPDRTSRFATGIFNRGIQIGVSRPACLHGTWMHMFKASIRLEQHNVIARRMRGRGAFDMGLHANRLVHFTQEVEAHSESVRHSLRNGTSGMRRRDPG